jgi:hypothetical protein
MKTIRKINTVKAFSCCFHVGENIFFFVSRMTIVCTARHFLHPSIYSYCSGAMKNIMENYYETRKITTRYIWWAYLQNKQNKLFALLLLNHHKTVTAHVVEKVKHMNETRKSNELRLECEWASKRERERVKGMSEITEQGIPLLFLTKKLLLATATRNNSEAHNLVNRK